MRGFIAVLVLVSLAAAWLLRGVVDPTTPSGTSLTIAADGGLEPFEAASTDVGATPTVAPVVVSTFQSGDGLPKGLVTGRILDERHDQPVAGALVGVSWPVELDPVVSGADGLFRFPDIPLDVVYLRATAHGYEASQLVVRLSYTRREADVVFTLRARPLRLGRVVDEGGAPVAGARVAQRVHGDDSAPVITDARGTFSAPMRPDLDVPPFEIDHPDFAPAVFVLTEDEQVCVLRRRARPFRGTVRDGAGAPIAGAEVECKSIEASTAVDPARKTVVVRTGADGAFAAAPIAPGLVVVRVRADGFLTWASDNTFAASFLNPFLPIDPEEAAEPLNVVMERPRFVRGQVIDQEGAVVPDAQVKARGYDRRWTSEAITDAAGLFTLARGDADSWEVAAIPKEGLGAVEINPDPEADGLVRLRIQGLSVLAGRVVDGETGRPVPMAVVTPWNGFNWSTGGPPTDAEGRFRVRCGRGQQSLHVRAAGYAPTKHAAGLDQAGQEIVIPLERVAGLVVRVKNADGAPHGGVRIRCDRLDGRGETVEERADATGFCEISTRPGRVLLRALGDSGFVANGAAILGELVVAEVGRGTMAEVDLRLAATGGLIVRFLTSSGLSVEGTNMTFTRVDGSVIGLRLEEGRAEELRAVAYTPEEATQTRTLVAGRWRVVLRFLGESVETQDVDVLPGQVATLVFRR